MRKPSVKLLYGVTMLSLVFGGISMGAKIITGLPTTNDVCNGASGCRVGNYWYVCENGVCQQTIYVGPLNSQTPPTKTNSKPLTTIYNPNPVIKTKP